MTDNLLAAFEGDVAAWLETVPPYQRELLQTMLAERDPEAVAVAWLASSGPSDTAPFGGFRVGATLFYSKLLEQLHQLVCTAEGYETERAQIIKDIGAGRAVLVTGIATAVAPALGAAPVILAPAIALTLAVLSRAGRDAFCETLVSMIDRQRQKEQPATNE